MKNIKFNFSKLKTIYAEAWKTKDPTITFEIKLGAGCFVFMMFLSKEDTEQNDKLFIYYRNINTLSHLKLYGHHLSGDFYAYITTKEEKFIMEELKLQQYGNPFNFHKFLNELNENIPEFITPSSKADILRKTWPNIKNKMKRIVKDADKTILIGLKNLPQGHTPKDKTLRKLYLHVEGITNEITSFIEAIKARNITLSWTDNPTYTAKTFAQLLSEFKKL